MTVTVTETPDSGASNAGFGDGDAGDSSRNTDRVVDRVELEVEDGPPAEYYDGLPEAQDAWSGDAIIRGLFADETDDGSTMAWATEA